MATTSDNVVPWQYRIRMPDVLYQPQQEQAASHEDRDRELEDYLAEQNDRTTALETRVGVRATRGTAQAFSASTLTDVTYTGETEDTDDFFTATSSTITVPTGKGGLYIITFVVSLSVSPSLSLYLYVNGSVIGQGAGSNAGTGVLTMVQALAAGDTVKSAIFGSSGGNINSAVLSCYRIGA